MKLLRIAVLFAIAATAHAQVPGIINYQGRVTVGGTNFDGTGQFQFALVNTDASQTFWSNGTGIVSVPVSKGLYSVLLGDTNITNMAVIPAGVFTNSDVRLRIWFNGGSGLQQLSPDQRVGAVGYALMAGNVPDGAITSGKLAAGAVGSAQLAADLTISGTVTAGSFIGNGAGLNNVAGTTPWQTATGVTQSAVANTGYLFTNAASSQLVLPSNANIGDLVSVSGVGTGGCTVATPWTPRDSSRGWVSVASSADGTKLVAVDSSPGQIYTSTDSGVTWTPRDNNRYWQSVASSADGTKLVAVEGGGQIYTSTDSGATWTPRDSSRMWWAVASSADGTKLVAVVQGGQIYTSTDSGTNWTPRDSSRIWISVASSADGTKLVAVVNGGQIYTSTDSGATWTPRDSSRSWYSVVSSADGTKLVAVVNGGQIYTSTPTYTSPTTTTTIGTSGYVAGGQVTAIELQYIGNGQWQPLSHEGTITGY